MKRQLLTLDDMTSEANLSLALWKAARGKRQRPDVVRFMANSTARLEQLKQAILHGLVPINQYRSFYVHDPKKRLIHAVSFPDRVLHHAIMNMAEPVFERTLVDSSYACRPGKGSHQAVLAAQHNSRRYTWYVQMDVSAYFTCIDHQTLFELLCKRFKGHDVLHLLERIVDSYHATRGKGLPIGSLTSQHFANYYLDGADRFLQENPLVCAQVRYMDDTVFWTHDRLSARRVLDQYKAYLHDNRFLSIKPTTSINRSQQGMTFCGFRVLPGQIHLSQRKKRRIAQYRQCIEAKWQAGDISDLTLQRRMDSVYGSIKLAQSRGWQKLNLQYHPDWYEIELGED